MARLDFDDATELALLVPSSPALRRFIDDGAITPGVRASVALYAAEDERLVPLAEYVAARVDAGQTGAVKTLADERIRWGS